MHIQFLLDRLETAEDVKVSWFLGCSQISGENEEAGRLRGCSHRFYMHPFTLSKPAFLFLHMASHFLGCKNCAKGLSNKTSCRECSHAWNVPTCLLEIFGWEILIEATAVDAAATRRRACQSIWMAVCCQKKADHNQWMVPSCHCDSIKFVCV